MQGTAFGSVHVLAHERTQFGACPSMPVDAELDYTCHGVAASIHKAPSTVSPAYDRADSYTCKELHAPKAPKSYLSLRQWQKRLKAQELLILILFGRVENATIYTTLHAPAKIISHTVTQSWGA